MPISYGNGADSDPDAGDSQTVIAVAAGLLGSVSGSVGSTVTGTYGSVTINSDGSFTFVVDESNAAVQALRTFGQTLSEVFTYTQQGSGGLQATAHLTITIHGQNDTPVGSNDTASATEAGGVANGTAGVNPTGNVLANDSDVDNGWLVCADVVASRQAILDRATLRPRRPRAIGGARTADRGTSDCRRSAGDLSRRRSAQRCSGGAANRTFKASSHGAPTSENGVGVPRPSLTSNSPTTPMPG